MKVTIADMIKCAEREIAMRKRVYPKWVDQGRMKRDDAVRELTHMRGILILLNGVSSLSGLLGGVEFSPDEQKEAAPHE